MEEKNSESLKREIYFEGSGEKIEIEISLSNFSPASLTKVEPYIDTMYRDIKSKLLKKV